jgi:uncharacterized membrane protein SirB2
MALPDSATKIHGFLANRLPSGGPAIAGKASTLYACLVDEAAAGATCRPQREGVLEAYYAEIRLVHLSAVLLSGTLFFLRGLAITVFGATWPRRAPVRYLTYTVDSVLLAAALMLTVAIHQYPFVDNWLTMKVVLLVVYIVLGTYALKRGKTEKIRLGAYLAALAVFAFIVSVARAHNPLGIFAML